MHDRWKWINIQSNEELSTEYLIGNRHRYFTRGNVRYVALSASKQYERMDQSMYDTEGSYVLKVNIVGVRPISIGVRKSILRRCRRDWVRREQKEQ